MGYLHRECNGRYINKTKIDEGIAQKPSISS